MACLPALPSLNTATAFPFPNSTPLPLVLFFLQRTDILPTQDLCLGHPLCLEYSSCRYRDDLPHLKPSLNHISIRIRCVYSKIATCTPTLVFPFSTFACSIFSPWSLSALHILYNLILYYVTVCCLPPQRNISSWYCSLTHSKHRVPGLTRAEYLLSEWGGDLQAANTGLCGDLRKPVRGHMSSGPGPVTGELTKHPGLWWEALCLCMTRVGFGWAMAASVQKQRALSTASPCM